MRMLLGDFSVGYSTPYVHATFGQLSPSPSPARQILSFPCSLYIHTYLLLIPLELWPTTPHFPAIYILDFLEKVFQFQIPHIALATLVYIAFLSSHLGCLFTPKFLVALVLYPVTFYFRPPSFCLRIRKWIIRF